jgi:hypothetical protein
VRLVESHKSPQVKISLFRALLKDAKMLVANLDRTDLKTLQDVGLESEHRNWLLCTPENLHGVLSLRLRATEDVSGTLSKAEKKANIPTDILDNNHNPTLYYIVGAHYQQHAKTTHTHHIKATTQVVYGLPHWDTNPETLAAADKVMKRSKKTRKDCTVDAQQSWTSMEVEDKNESGTITSDFEEVIRQGIRGGLQPHSVVRPSVLQHLQENEDENKWPPPEKHAREGTTICTSDTYIYHRSAKSY